MTRAISITSACALAGMTGSAWADPEPAPEAPKSVGAETIVVVDPGPAAARDRARALGDAPFVSVIHPDEHPATASVADAIATTVGAHTRSLGGLGAYESVSIRGAAPGHTEVLIDGVPLARLAEVTTDLGRFSLGSFGEVDVYRGAVPVELGGAGVGGAINLVTHLGRGDAGDRVQLSAGLGSFGARHLRAHYGDDHDGGAVLSSTTIGYQGATGNFAYFDNGGTPLNPNDDGFRTRTNNRFDQLDAASRLGTRDGSIVGGARVAYKDQGLPGSSNAPTMSASMATLDAMGDGRFDAQLGPATARQLGYLLVEHQRLRDPDAELGLGAQDRTYTTITGGASTTWSLPHRITTGLELRGDRFHDEASDGSSPSLTGTRVGGAALASLDLSAGSVVVTPAIRLDALRTHPTALTVGPMAYEAVAPRWDVVPSPRLTARAPITSDLVAKASAGWYVRLPTLVELFGDRGYILGAPELRPERGPSADLGGVWAPARGYGAIDRIFVEAAAFATHASDTISFISTAGTVARAANLGTTETLGGELVVAARLAKTISFTSAYTRLMSRQLDGDPTLEGKQLPRRPAHALYARTDIVRRILDHTASAWLDANVQSETFLDPANLGRVPSRTLVGAGVHVDIAAGLGLGVAVANLTDVRISELPLSPPPNPAVTRTPTAVADVAGFPLPGRSFYISADWSY